MDRRTALATAGAVTLVVLAGSAAIATNLELLGSTAEVAPAGELEPVDLTETSPSPAATGEAVTTVVVEPSFLPDAGLGVAGVPSAVLAEPGVQTFAEPAPAETVHDVPTDEPTAFASEFEDEHEDGDGDSGRGRGRGRGRGGDDDD